MENSLHCPANPYELKRFEHLQIGLIYFWTPILTFLVNSRTLFYIDT